MQERDQQILQTHAVLIVQVVHTCGNPEHKQALLLAVKAAESNGWVVLAQTIRKILDGNRDDALLNGLDEEDHVIIKAILRGLQDPSTLPDPTAKADASSAAPGLASIIHAAGTGDTGALEQIATMAEGMSRAGGDMAMIAGCIRPMVNGERDANKLCEKLSLSSEGLVLAILSELGKLTPQ
ncbi:MAG TPA: hypothetical protein EYN73_07315 [Chromatiaceae bacterium]|jgi:hypothetical protein|nr:hypothetical protein [Chromatiaceae bacterium]HIA08859.1 hypothetical protein [Chromatiaceae bacterium]HIN81906.1 hypothetical protein [Chromatiales bacterium]HIO14718.1 hypothetical protein [Chromatiales bacterium]HIO54927.1 hypothetical protein [Chromatiales bacterium]